MVLDLGSLAVCLALEVGCKTAWWWVEAVEVIQGKKLWLCYLRYPLEPGITYGDHGRWMRQRLPKMNPLCTRRVTMSFQYF